MPVTYGDISPRTQAKAEKELLKRGTPHLMLEHWGQSKPLGPNETKSITFRRYEALDATPTALVEGVKPAGKSLTKTDVTATLVQRGDYIELTDVVLDTHEDPVLMESTEILGEQAAQMYERARFGVLKAGTNVFYAGAATARNQVAGKMTRTLQRRITRALKAQNANFITKKLKASPNYATEPVAAAFVAVTHTDVENDIRDMDGFVPVEKYATGTPLHEGEVGKVENVRYCVSPIFDPYPDAGAVEDGTYLSTDGDNNDVYPILFIAQNAYGIVPLKGKGAINLMIRNPKPDSGDPLAQTGTAGWKGYETSVILNDAWLVRAEVAATI
ncbi:N4-gp56 family major capsid protein [Salinispirillum sp. LH 10-3-1]|uniref:N4-gp56 family major capsid protein n=1 Tax=Salinispirillum sp. LH 10-3-1 TaxID=2952525 RepID=A0AB38YC44_9GAMM